MKRILTLMGTVMLFAGIRAKAQNAQQPAKKETAKPVNTAAPKPEAIDSYLKLGTLKGESKTAPVAKNSNPAFLKTANPTFVKGSQPVATQQVAPRHKGK
ncbi:MAG TPA: hypothetical protein VHW43_00525 [Puia sp.]|nr:hypothetical protein [Puia sp.]